MSADRGAAFDKTVLKKRETLNYNELGYWFLLSRWHRMDRRVSVPAARCMSCEAKSELNGGTNEQMITLIINLEFQ